MRINRGIQFMTNSVVHTMFISFSTPLSIIQISSSRRFFFLVMNFKWRKISPPVSNFQTLKSMSESLEWGTMVGERTGKKQEKGREKKEGKERERVNDLEGWMKNLRRKKVIGMRRGMDNWNEGKRETYFFNYKLEGKRERERETSAHLNFSPFSSHSISSFFLDTFSTLIVLFLSSWLSTIFFLLARMSCSFIIIHV